MSNPNPNQTGLWKGNPNNRGGGETLAARRSKRAFLDAIRSATNEQGEVFGDLLDQKLFGDLLASDGEAARRWFTEMEYGKPQSKVTMMVERPDILRAVAQALHRASVEVGVTHEQARFIIGALETLLAITEVDDEPEG